MDATWSGDVAAGPAGPCRGAAHSPRQTPVTWLSTVTGSAVGLRNCWVPGRAAGLPHMGPLRMMWLACRKALACPTAHCWKVRGGLVARAGMIGVRPRGQADVQGDFAGQTMKQHGPDAAVQQPACVPAYTPLPLPSPSRPRRASTGPVTGFERPGGAGRAPGQGTVLVSWPDVLTAPAAAGYGDWLRRPLANRPPSRSRSSKGR